MKKKELRVELNLDVPGAYIGYVSDNFNIHYAPDMAANCANALPHVDETTATLIRKVAASARACIESWEIRDSTDRRDADRGLAACKACGV